MSLHSDVILERLLKLHPKIIDLSLERLERLLERLGNPHLDLPPVIHIAGTNGKGSTAAFIRAGLEADGKRVHMYTSPHLARFHERIRLAGHLIDEETLAELLEVCEIANDGAPITFFEITTAAAFLAFSKAPADYVILEVGLGGRLDATNVIDQALLTIITPVSIDHQQYLGDTLADIALEKAGILKPETLAILGQQEDEALKVISARADALNALILAHGTDWLAFEEHGRLIVQHPDGLDDLPLPALPGPHQLQNAGLAVAALRALGLADEASLAKALMQVEWPARMQRLKSGPLTKRLPAGAELWLDGGHNEAAGTALGDTLANINALDPRPLYLITGMINTKNPAGFLKPLAHLAHKLYGVTIPEEAASLPGDEIASAALSAGIDAVPASGIEAALKAALKDSLGLPKAPRILICGSLYLAGKILRNHA